MNKKVEYKEYLRPIDEDEMKSWRSTPKSFTTELFEEFLESNNKMVEVDIKELPLRIQKDQSRMKTTKQDSFASAFYAWKRKRQPYLKLLKTDVLLIRRGGRVALKKTKETKTE
jgi:hypothetical protein